MWYNTQVPQGEPDGSHLYCRLAAFIDGEGSIGVHKTRTKHTLAMLRRASPKYQMSVCVINTNQILIKWLKDNFGGSITTRKKAKENHKTAYRWVVGDQRAVVILRKVLPFLVIKTPQAKLAIEFTEGFVKGASLGHGHGSRVSEKEIERRDRIHAKLKVLNARGVAPAETKREDTATAVKR